MVFREKLLSLIQSFLQNRKQRTVLNGQCSTWGNILAGVPQGSILGPLLFLVYINDLTANLKCNVKLFADDTSVFTIVNEPNVASEELNHDLALISQWAHDWRMSFNPDPQKQAIGTPLCTLKGLYHHLDTYTIPFEPRMLLGNWGEERKNSNLAFIPTAHLNGTSSILRLGMYHPLLCSKLSFYQ